VGSGLTKGEELLFELRRRWKVRSRAGPREVNEGRALIRARLLIAALQIVLVAYELWDVVGL